MVSEFAKSKTDTIFVSVLILIVVEYGLGEMENYDRVMIRLDRLNPYCSGIWSRRMENYDRVMIRLES